MTNQRPVRTGYGLLLLILAMLAPTMAAGQSFGDIPQSQRDQVLQAMESGSVPDSASKGGSSEPQSNTNWKTGATYGPVLTDEEREEVRPFGAELFSGGFRGLRSDGLNPDYRVLPGDQVTLRIWGAVDIDQVMPVDAQGNIFIPAVGPVQVEGVSHSQLDAVVRQAVQEVYPNNVNVYTNLQGVQPVAVFVTGYVEKPGRYAGVPSDSVLYLLDQASGVDDELGSYRKIRLIRDGETIARVDLYDFLRTGTLNHPQLQEGDTVLVEPRGPSVLVSGDVGRPHHFELLQDELNGESLVDLVQLKSGVSHVLLRGDRRSGPFFDYQELEKFEEKEISNGDEIVFLADQRSDEIVVQLEGAYLGSSYFVLSKGTTLHELLNAVAVDPNETAFESISIRRESVAEQQRTALEESLRRLETTYLGASSSTAEESAIRIQEAELISQFVQRAREVEPNGRLVVANEGELVDIRLQDKDVVTLPQRTDSILVSGEVYIPQSVVFVAGKNAMDYIEGAGGFSQHADEDHILVARQNGEVRRASDVPLRPGDQILVMPKVETKNLQIASTVTQILYQIAVATKVALDI
ncbi:polysaccharide biosynthesis/export family protein [Marinobacter sp. ATCH36]|uniref:polysaccharide biosynthesis/export family protein n=1 Tax=Marinobacter sp. ATCH36 TaxID=2945106 RepID=UPI0020216397|nr:polysaccharide biosynthesis/export family protein [Marinobacter sp. ATCH36]MCL7945153.1 polysaccharide biosynthesis/export family protein [Marinobacter sp. ATCH36]